MNWIPHNNNKRPKNLHPKDAIEIKRRNGSITLVSAGEAGWIKYGTQNDIVWYRIVNKYISLLTEEEKKNGWIEFNEGDTLLHGKTYVKVRFRDLVEEEEKADEFEWRNSGNRYDDIIAYKVTKAPMKKEFVKSSDVLASIDTPRMMDKTFETILISVYANFGKVRAIKALRLIKNLDLSVAKDTVEKYIPSMEYAKNLLTTLLEEHLSEKEKICVNHAIDL